MSAIRVTVLEAKGSTPRDAGTAMLVFADRIEGTIGGGALEWQAMATAREMLSTGETKAERRVALGPSLGQCCGGAVTLAFQAADQLPKLAQCPLWVWGAGHVGRAIVSVLAPSERIAVTWIDANADRFPGATDASVQTVVASTPQVLMARAPTDAHHLILTYSHDVDLALCHAALKRGFASCGLIGSATKWARFRSRLADLGHSESEITCITSPIGDPSLGKDPQAIAIGVAAGLLSQLH